MLLLLLLVISYHSVLLCLIRRQVIVSYAPVCQGLCGCTFSRSYGMALFLLSSVLHRGTSQASSAYSETSSEFQFSEAVLRQGKVVCSKCFKKNANLKEKDPVLKTCPVHRDTAWNSMLVWPSKAGYVPIRSRPRNVIVDFTLCRYRTSCHLGERCLYPHSKEELEVWTLDRDGGKLRRWEVALRFIQFLCCRELEVSTSKETVSL